MRGGVRWEIRFRRWYYFSRELFHTHSDRHERGHTHRSRRHWSLSWGHNISKRLSHRPSWSHCWRTNPLLPWTNLEWSCHSHHAEHWRNERWSSEIFPLQSTVIWQRWWTFSWWIHIAGWFRVVYPDRMIQGWQNRETLRQVPRFWAGMWRKRQPKNEKSSRQITGMRSWGRSSSVDIHRASSAQRWWQDLLVKSPNYPLSLSHSLILKMFHARGMYSQDWYLP